MCIESKGCGFYISMKPEYPALNHRVEGESFVSAVPAGSMAIGD